MDSCRDSYELSTADKIRDCRQFKLAGNFFFREGQFFRAAEKYRRVRCNACSGSCGSCLTVCAQILIFFEYAFPDTPEETQVLGNLRFHALLNLAACKLRTKQYDEAVKFASQVRVCAAPANGCVVSKGFQSGCRPSPSNQTVSKHCIGAPKPTATVMNSMRRVKTSHRQWRWLQATLC